MHAKSGTVDPYLSIPQLGIDRIPQRIAEQPDAQHRQHDGHTWKHRDPRRHELNPSNESGKTHDESTSLGTPAKKTGSPSVRASLQRFMGTLKPTAIAHAEYLFA
jgi:hypothetical protein